MENNMAVKPWIKLVPTDMYWYKYKYEYGNFVLLMMWCFWCTSASGPQHWASECTWASQHRNSRWHKRPTDSMSSLCSGEVRRLFQTASRRLCPWVRPVVFHSWCSVCLWWNWVDSLHEVCQCRLVLVLWVTMDNLCSQVGKTVVHEIASLPLSLPPLPCCHIILFSPICPSPTVPFIPSLSFPSLPWSDAALKSIKGVWTSTASFFSQDQGRAFLCYYEPRKRIWLLQFRVTFVCRRVKLQVQ